MACPENEALADFMWEKKHQMADKNKSDGRKTLSDNAEITLYKAYSGICNSNTPIKTLKDLANIKGVGKWILRLMQEFFETECSASQDEDIITKGKKPKGTKRYVPQKNSVAYALLITLYRAIANGSDFMRRQELIDAAEASGLSRAPIAPEKGKGKPGQFGSSSRDWYSGWSCMKTLITKGLVAKSSNPAKYMLTVEGQEAARDCLLRSDQIDLTTTSRRKDPGTNSGSDHDDMSEDMIVECVHLSSSKKSIDVPPQSLDRFLRMGYSTDQVISAFTEVAETSQSKDMSSLWPAVLCLLREKQVYDLSLDPNKNLREDSPASSNASQFKNCQVDHSTNKSSWAEADDVDPSHVKKSSFPLRACSSNGIPAPTSGSESFPTNIKALVLPPLLFGERFVEAYEVILILDNREQFATQGSKSRKIIENIKTQFHIQIEVRWLPVGDAIWIAKHKILGTEYVLDFIVERKKIDDLRVSIRDNRYKDQKLRLLRCGLKKLMYVVEGDPNRSEAAESIKTACLTTEILEGFNVLRTSGLGDTLRNYGFLTQAIAQLYNPQSVEKERDGLPICPAFDEFVLRCQNLEKMTVSDVFAIQLMQVPQVTEEIADAVQDLYPTLLSLARAYFLLEGDIHAQEEMLKKSNSRITSSASRNIFQLVWAS